MEDMEVGWDEALNIMEESQDLGTCFYPDE